MTKAVRTIRPEFLPRSIAKAIFKRKRLVAALWLIATGLVVEIVYQLEAVYTANAVILVESQKIPEAFVTATVQTTLEARLDMLKQQVLSHDRLWSLVEDLNLYPTQRRERTRDEVLTLMRDDIKISLARGWSARGPGAFQVEYKAPKASLAADVANRIGMFFITENLRQRTGEAAGTSEFLDKQLAGAEKRLREQEAILKEFKLNHNGELPQQEAALLASMSQSRTELLGIQEAIGRAQQNKLMLENSASYGQALLRELQQQQQLQAQRGHAAEQVNAADPMAASVPPQPTPLQRAQAELGALRARYFDSHPEVQRAMQEVQRLEREETAQAAASARQRPSQDVSRTPSARPAASVPENGASAPTSLTQGFRLDELRAQIGLAGREIETLERRRDRILSEIGETQGRVRNMPVREQQLAGIMRDYETSKTNYDSLLNKKLAAEVAFNMEQWQKSQKFVMLDEARVPQRPASPRRMLLIAAGAMASLFASALLAFLVELRNNVLLGEWEVPRTAQVLGRIPILPVGRA